jgi:ABC-type lipoprotein release transport system permease subunit
LPEIFEKMPNLTVLYCKGNDFVRKISNYRKTLIYKIPSLEYLDERPVTSEERRRAIAFGVGQHPAEKQELEKIKAEREYKREVHLTKFQTMVQKSKADKADLVARVEKDQKLSLQELLSKAKKDQKEALESTNEDMVFQKVPEEAIWTP